MKNIKIWKITFYISTGIVVIGMLIVGILEFIPINHFVEQFARITVSYDLMRFMAVAKIIGAIILVVPAFKFAREWAYAGFTFVFVGAIVAHLSVADPINEFIPALFNFLAIVLSRVALWKLEKQ